MKKSILLFMLFLTIESKADTLSFLNNNMEQLAEGMVSVMTFNGNPVQDIAWPGYPLLNANGVMNVLSDVMGPQEPNGTFSTPAYFLWSDYGNYRLQTRYADFGGNCDLNNPSTSTADSFVVTPPSLNTGNSAQVSGYLSYVQKSYNSCDQNSHYSKNSFHSIPLMTRTAWVYRACQKLALNSDARAITLMANRIQSPDPTPTPTIPIATIGPVSVTVSSNGTDYLSGDHPNPTPTPTPTPTPVFNWCNSIQQPSPENLQSLFRAFYPNRNIPKRNNLTLKRSGGLSQIPATSYSSVDQYQEKLLGVINASNTYISSLSANTAATLETGCTYPVMNSTPPTLDAIKAVNAWRAIFMTMCSDPGWQLVR